MKKILTVASVVLTFSAAAQKINTKQIIREAEQQTLLLLKETEAIRVAKPNLVAPRTYEHGELKLVPSRDWTSGFFAGELWMLYAFTKNKIWQQQAEKYTALLEQEKWNAGTHDMGFKMYCSYGTGYALTKDTAYKNVLIRSAKTLASRFHPKVGAIRSWDHHKEVWQFPVIIDNMMNLELLFAATRLTGDSSFYNIAVSHANTTLKNHFRSDNSSFHVIDYDTLTGAVLQKNTHQGHAHTSAWARGQAWGLYGYTMCYRETKDPTYLQQAEKIAAFFFSHPNLPEDAVPYWDFNAPDIPNAPRDASAAAVMASGLYELSGYSKNGKQYRKYADKIMSSLMKYYRSPIGENKGFILVHSTGNLPSNGEIDVPINYADYYFLEALGRREK
ncbi:glycoside hydrolase family 88 protein [Parasegetibacter sp. NRK P23]|uniref:glycoside hydrolase family 88 protein n=1 Tax=Parasegetibacter sp. NRK P23 TaxID=2942999 RepID=UPI0020446371|nr:glycoside hydrolase family 88 protein [Parasegetibacter sp. NRK P23]MCM5527903.1 glycoside hydrolase family 88 protein [Parasegetibacter sp. NRK P23]